MSFCFLNCLKRSQVVCGAFMGKGLEYGSVEFGFASFENLESSLFRLALCHMSHTPEPADRKMGLKALFTFINTFLCAETSAKTVLHAETPIGKTFRRAHI